MISSSGSQGGQERHADLTRHLQTYGIRAFVGLTTPFVYSIAAEIITPVRREML